MVEACSADDGEMVAESSMSLCVCLPLLLLSLPGCAMSGGLFVAGCWGGGELEGERLCSGPRTTGIVPSGPLGAAESSGGGARHGEGLFGCVLTRFTRTSCDLVGGEPLSRSRLVGGFFSFLVDLGTERVERVESIALRGCRIWKLSKTEGVLVGMEWNNWGKMTKMEKKIYFTSFTYSGKLE